MDKDAYNLEGYGYDQPSVNRHGPPDYSASQGWSGQPNGNRTASHGLSGQPNGSTPASQGWSEQPVSVASNSTLIQMQPGVGPGVPNQTIIFQQPENYSMTGHYCFSCFVFWFCNMLCGAIAFFVAVCGSGKPAANARSYGRASMTFNILGIVMSLAIVGVFLGLYFTGVIFADESTGDILANGISDAADNLNGLVKHAADDIDDYMQSG